MKIEKVNIAVIGQGYVGLPLAIEFGKKYPTIGFDINQARIVELKKGIDHTNEAEIKDKYEGILLAVSHSKFLKLDIESFKKNSKSIVYDLKGFLPRNQVDSRL